jgi:hypothetical protein
MLLGSRVRGEVVGDERIEDDRDLMDDDEESDL